MSKIRGNEKYFAIAILAVAVGLAVGGYFVSSIYVGSLIANLAATFFGLGVGLYIVNIYLDRQSRKEAVSSLLQLIGQSIRDHHNALLDAAWDRFGRPQFGEIIDRYASNGGDPRSLTPQERQTIYDMVKTEKTKYEVTFSRLEAELKELALVLGWSFDPTILQVSFRCRYAITKLRAATFDDTEHSKLEVCEHFLDTDIFSSIVYQKLVDLIGLDKREVYADRRDGEV